MDDKILTTKWLTLSPYRVITESVIVNKTEDDEECYCRGCRKSKKPVRYLGCGRYKAIICEI
jgi:hypothetical protein